PAVNDRAVKPSAGALLKDLGTTPRLTVFLAGAPGAGKTRRLLDDALRLQQSGVRVVLGWVETSGRHDLERLAAQLPRIAARRIVGDGVVTESFDVEAALTAQPQVVILDDLARHNLPGCSRATHWQDALALRNAGIGVSGAFDIAHLETVATAAEKVIGRPAQHLVPLSFLREADQVIALDASPQQIASRLGSPDAYRPEVLRSLRDLMLRIIDDLETPVLPPRRTSTALALATGDGDATVFLRNSASLAHALDLALDIAVIGEHDIDAVAQLSRDLEAHVVPLERFDPIKPQLAELRATLVSIPCGDLAYRIATRPAERDAFIVDATVYATSAEPQIVFPRYAQTIGDRLRVGYGRLTVYLGAAAGSGKTYAMLDRALQLREDGIDVVGAFVETHERADVELKARDVEIVPRLQRRHDGRPNGDLDVPALFARRPAVALIDDLSHANASGDSHPRRYDDVLEIIRAGISVMTTLDVAHLEGLSDAVHRLTGGRPQETVPDEVLEIADEIILVDANAETLRERVRAGKVCRPEKIDDALAHDFRSENLSALRELALREVVHARGAKRAAPFSRLVLGVKARERDAELIERCARIALRLEIDLSVVHVARSGDGAPNRIVDMLAETARRVRARWRVASGADAALVLVDAMQGSGPATLAIEGARHRPVWPRGFPFARRLLDAGAKQLLILAPPL
ncbi:MAG: hypothetical protein M3R44_00565, partial [Candidatus Eremiobacteraeota bacterium]|nr:hypothetical protein [Candidatus Eremiobacteraeota bacterium]